MPTQTQRISDLFDHLWPLMGYHFRWEMQSRAAHLSIMQPDRLRVLAQVSFTPKFSADMTELANGYDVRVTYPGLNGTLDELEQPALIIGALGPVLRRMAETELISGVAP